MARSLGVGIDARDLATVVDVQRVGRQAPREIDGRDDSFVEQEAADLAPFGVDGSDLEAPGTSMVVYRRRSRRNPRTTKPGVS
jgi:hypothetical protein